MVVRSGGVERRDLVLNYSRMARLRVQVGKELEDDGFLECRY